MYFVCWHRTYEINVKENGFMWNWFRSVNFRMNLLSHRFSQKMNKKVRISALTTQGRNPDNFLFVLWEKRWLFKFILKLTDLLSLKQSYLETSKSNIKSCNLSNCRINFFLYEVCKGLCFNKKKNFLCVKPRQLIDVSRFVNYRISFGLETGLSFYWHIICSCRFFFFCFSFFLVPLNMKYMPNIYLVWKSWAIDS